MVIGLINDTDRLMIKYNNTHDTGSTAKEKYKRNKVL